MITLPTNNNIVNHQLPADMHFQTPQFPAQLNQEIRMQQMQQQMQQQQMQFQMCMEQRDSHQPQSNSNYNIQFLQGNNQGCGVKKYNLYR